MSSVMRRDGARGAQWVVRFRVDGAQRAKSFTSAAAAERWRAVLDNAGPAVALDLLRGPAEESTETGLDVATWVAQHIAALTGVTDGTRATYRAMLARDVAPLLGDVPLAGLTRQAVAGWVNHLQADGQSGKTIKNKHALLSAAMSAAVLEGHAATNPCRGIRLPSTSHNTNDLMVLTSAQQRALLAQLPEPYRSLVLVLLRTGLRFGEATALPARNLHLHGHQPTLRVTQAWKKTAGGPKVLGPPKSPRSRRTVVLDDETAATLATAAGKRRGEELVLRAPQGGVVWHGAFVRVWRPAVVRAGIDPALRIHDLRHTHASVLIAAGVPLTHLQRRLGHESIKTTSDRYGHLTGDAHAAMRVVLGDAFRSAG